MKRLRVAVTPEERGGKFRWWVDVWEPPYAQGRTSSTGYTSRSQAEDAVAALRHEYEVAWVDHLLYRPGDRVVLNWNGSSHVPKWLHQSEAVVLRVTRKGFLVVQPDLDTGLRTINPGEHVLRRISAARMVREA